MRWATRLIRAGVASDVPPYFWTRTGRATASGSALNIALPSQPLSQEHSALAGAQLGVVREDNVLHAIQDRFVAKPSDRHRHTVARIAIAPWLRAEWITIDAQQPLGSRRQAVQSLRAKRLHGGGRGARIARPLRPDENRPRMSVLDVDARAGAGNAEVRRLLPGAEDLLRLAFDLLFLAGDEWDDIVDDVERQHAALPARA